MTALHARRRIAGPPLLVAGIVGAALVLRLIGADHGLPFVWNPDEHSHFVPRAVGFFQHGYNPGYFVNPPAFTYALHVVFAAVFGGSSTVGVFEANPERVYLVARVATAGLGAAATWLMYPLGKRLFGSGVGLVAAALSAVAFLPVFQAHQAVNDVPALVPLTLALYGAAGVLHGGNARDYLLAGAGLGLAIATKYTSGIVVVAIAAAVVFRVRAAGFRELRWALLAGTAALGAFLAANPFFFADLTSPDSDLALLTVAPEGLHKLGQAEHNGVRYYLWALTWGLGWVPCVAALGGAVVLTQRNRAAAALLVPMPVLYVAFMGGFQDRFFGRWLLPVFPAVILLAAYGSLTAWTWARSRFPRRPGMLAAAGLLALVLQSITHVVHTDVVLTREDTRTSAFRWVVDLVPEDDTVVLEELGRPTAWERRPARPRLIGMARALRQAPWFPRDRAVVSDEFPHYLRPDLVELFERRGWCWVAIDSSTSGRAYAEPALAPRAVAYYEELERSATLVREFSPYDAGARPVPFNYDWANDYYPFSYHRPGPVVSVYRLDGGRCSS